MPERFVREWPGHRVTRHTLSAALPTPRIVVDDAALKYCPVGLEQLSDGFEAELVEAAERGEVRGRERRVVQVEVFRRTVSVRTSILEDLDVYPRTSRRPSTTPSTAKSLFLVVGLFFVIFGTPTGAPVGFSLIAENGGIFPSGVVPAAVMIGGVVFAYAGIELVGTTAGEAADPHKEIPRAVNSVVFRIAVFYCGSVLLLCLLLPFTAYSADESPFVTFFSSINVGAAGPLMQLVVITAAMSSMNAGIYSTGRILHSMSVAGSAPKLAGKINAQGVPVGGILLTAVMAFIGVALNIFVPEQAFEIVMNIGAVGVMAAWVTIVMSHRKFVKLSEQGLYQRPSFRSPLGVFGDWLVVGFVVVVLFLMAIDYPVGSWTLGLVVVVVVPALVIGWFVVRDRVMEISRTRDSYTDLVPIGTLAMRDDELAPRPLEGPDGDDR